MARARRKVKHRSPENHFIPAPRSGPKKSRARASKGETPLPGKSFHRSAWSARRKVNTTPFPPKRPKSPTGHPRALGKVPQSIPQWMFSESISDAFHPGDFPISPRLTRGRSTAAPYQLYGVPLCTLLYSTLLYSTPFVLLEEVHREIWPRAAARKNPGPARRKMKHHSPENHFTVPRGAGASKGETPLPGKSFHRSAWSARRKMKHHSPENHFTVPRPEKAARARRKVKHHSPENHFTVPRGPRVERSTPLHLHLSAQNRRRAIRER